MIAVKKLAVFTAMAFAAACSDAPTAANASAQGTQPALNHIGAYISGPNPVTCSGYHTYDSNPSGGSSYTYQWYYKPYGFSNWYSLGTSRTATQWIDVGDPTMELRVDVTSGFETATRYLTVYGPTTNNIC